ncbi:hypothetical protein JCM5296_006471 [Sporobolomyces johnsonii]
MNVHLNLTKFNQREAVKAYLQYLRYGEIDPAALYLSDKVSWKIVAVTTDMTGVKVDLETAQGLVSQAEDVLSMDKQRLVAAWKKYMSELVEETTTFEMRDVDQTENDTLTCGIEVEELTTAGKCEYKQSRLLVQFEPGATKILKGIELVNQTQYAQFKRCKA